MRIEYIGSKKQNCDNDVNPYMIHLDKKSRY